MKNLFANTFEGKTVLVTGNTGFKGSWLSTWLIELGAYVVGFSLPDPPTRPSNFELSNLSKVITDLRGDIRNVDDVKIVIDTYRPEIIFHLAAQPIVLRSLSEPKLTFDTNALGTVNVLEALRSSDSVRVLVSITTDKVYHNQGYIWGYRENDRLGDYDPYGASKAMAELAIASYRESFFPPGNYAQHGVGIASVRAGNVIGGGDFADFRLVPDCIRALLVNEPIRVRYPSNVRPWQHVLEPLSGYLWLAAKLYHDGPHFAEAWNFGPLEQKGITAQNLVDRLLTLWGSGSWVHDKPDSPKVETGQLRLSWEKAAARLDWRPVFTWTEALSEIVDWYKAYNQSADMYVVARRHILDYVQRAEEIGIVWT